MSNLTELIDIHSLDHCGDTRQNPKTNNLVFTGQYPRVEKFEEIQTKDRAGRDSSILNVKGVNNWELWTHEDACKDIDGGHSRTVKALSFLDGVQGSTDAIQGVKDSWMAVGLTELIHGTGDSKISLKDGGDQTLLFMGDTTKTSSYIEVRYKRNLPEVGDKIKFREDFFAEYIKSNYLEEITYSASEYEYTHSTTELKQGNHYTIKVTGKATREDGTIVDGNFQIPQGNVGKANVISFGISNSQGIPISDYNATYINGGEYTKSFTATKNATIGFRLEDFDRTNTVGSFTIKLYESIKQPIKSGVVKSVGNVHILNPFNKEGQASEEYVVKSINEGTNEFTLKRSDRDSMGFPAVTTHIISPTHGKWWSSTQTDCSLDISGKSDDETAFNKEYSIEVGLDAQKLDLFAIVANANGLNCTYNGQAWYTVTSKLCYSLSAENITIGNASSVTEVDSASISKERRIRHFEWMFFDQELLSENGGNRMFTYSPTKLDEVNDDMLYIFSYLRCKYGYPWLNGLEEIGKWKQCKFQQPPKDVPEIEPPIATCCFTQVSWTFWSHTYETIYETTATTPQTEQFFRTELVAGTASQETVTTDQSGNTGTDCTDLSDTLSVWGQSGETKSDWTWNIYGPFGIPTSSAEIFPIPCVPPVDRGRNKLKNRLNAFLKGVKSLTYETTVGAQGEHKLTSSVWSKPKAYTSPRSTKDIGKYVTYLNSMTGRIVDISHGAHVLSDITYTVTNLYAKNDVIAEGSQSTTGSTTLTYNEIRGFAYVSCKPKYFGGSWTYVTPIRDVFPYTAMVDETFTTKTILQSSSTIKSEYPSVEAYGKFSEVSSLALGAYDNKNFKPDEIISYVVFDITAPPYTFRVFEDDSVANEFTTTDITQVEGTSQYYGDYYTTSTASTSEVAFKGGETEFKTMKYELVKTSDYTLIRTFETTALGSFTTTMNALSYENMDKDSTDIKHYGLCGEKSETEGISFLHQYKGTDTGQLWVSNPSAYTNTNYKDDFYEAYSDRFNVNIAKRYDQINEDRNHARYRRLNTYGDDPINNFVEFEYLNDQLKNGKIMEAVVAGADYEQRQRIAKQRRQYHRGHREFTRNQAKSGHSFYATGAGDAFWGEVRRGTNTSSSRPVNIRVTTQSADDSTFTKWSTSAQSSSWKNIAGNTKLLVQDKRLSAELAPYNQARNGAWPRPDHGSTTQGGFRDFDDYRQNFPHSLSSTMPDRRDRWRKPEPPYNPINDYYNRSPSPTSWYEINTFSHTRLLTAENECFTE